MVPDDARSAALGRGQVPLTREVQECPPRLLQETRMAARDDGKSSGGEVCSVASAAAVQNNPTYSFLCFL